MTQTKSVLDTLHIFAGMENEFVSLWEKASTLARLGALSAQQRANLHKVRDSLHSQQLWLRTSVVRVVGSIPGVAAQIPMPGKFPDLPLPGAAPQAALRVNGLQGVGLGIPLPLIIAGVIIAIVAIYAVVQVNIIAADAVAEIFQQRAIIQETSRRFDDCRSTGGTTAECTAAVPVPVFVPRSTAGDGIPGWAWAVMGIGAAALLLGGLYVYGASSAPRIERGMYSLPRRVR